MVVVTDANHLVLEAFVGPRPKGFVARHFPDRDPTNNNVNNLQWGTYQENSDDKYFHKTMVNGNKVNTCKLTPKQVREIRRLYKPIRGLATKLAKIYPITPGNISRIGRGLMWKHII